MILYSDITTLKYGALKGSGSLTTTQKSQVVANTLACKYIRARIVVLNDITSGTGGWTGSSSVYELNQSLNLKQVLVINAYPTGTAQPYITASEYAAYKSTVAAILAKYPDIWFIIVDNEEQTQIFHTGNMSDYINYQLRAVYEVAHPLGIKVADGGIIDGAGLHIRVYQWLVTTYNQTVADTYATGSAMSPHQIRYAKGIDTDATFDGLVADVDTIIAGRIYVDFFNTHYYENPGNTSATTIIPNVFRFHKEYIETIGKRPVITNEIGQISNSQPLLVTNIMNEFYRLKVPIVQWWDGTGSSGAVPLTNDTTGAILPNGTAFKNFIITHYG